MPRTILISLPVTDLKVSKAFYTALGFVNNPQCSDDGSALMVLSDTISIVLLTHEKWSTLTTRAIAPKNSSEVGIMVSCESREEVDAMNNAAAEHGGVGDVNPIQDHGTMYGRDFADPDGHIWGALWMDKSAMQ